MEATFRQALSDLPLGPICYLDATISTNNDALAWAADNAPDLSLVFADAQTGGRGRMGRKWFTSPGAALAFSLILRPTPDELAYPSRITGLLAVSLVAALQTYNLSPLIKWPNDVLIHNRKVAGILVESTWSGEQPEAFVLGMGVNVLKNSVPPSESLLFPAASLEDELGEPIKRPALLHAILSAFLKWRPRLGTDALINFWDAHLAFRNRQVRIEAERGKIVTGEILKLAPDGGLILRDEHGKTITVFFGDVHVQLMT